MVDCSYKQIIGEKYYIPVASTTSAPSNQAVGTALISFCSIKCSDCTWFCVYNTLIWARLVSMCSLTSVPLDSSVLVVLGSAFNTLWKCHWRCIIEEQWRSATIFDNFKLDNVYFISSWVAAVGDNTSVLAPLS